MISEKHFTLLLRDILAEDVKSLSAFVDGRWWYAIGRGHWAFASHKRVLHPDCVEASPALLELVSGAVDLVELTPTGFLKNTGGRKYVELSAEAGDLVYIAENYLRLFPEKEYAYSQTANKPLSPIFCTRRCSGLMEGLVAPSRMPKREGDSDERPNDKV